MSRENHFSLQKNTLEKGSFGRVDAFSLVEVTIAVGIIAISMVSMLMLMPIGLSGMRAARTETVRAQIVQYMTSKAQTTAFSGTSIAVSGTNFCLADLATLDSSGNKIKDPYYFDDQGRLTLSGTLNVQTLNTRYMVEVSKNDPATDPVTFPGAGLSASAGIQTLVATSVAKLKIYTTQIIPANPPVYPPKTIGKKQLDVIFVPNQGG